MGRQLRIRMTARAPDEPHRAATQLELLFDLTFVIAIASLTGRFAHAIAGGHALEELVPFLQVFFAIWWAWINFTWFASSFDTDDVAFRLLTMVQMAGVLVLAAGVPVAFDHGDLSAITLGYVIMRLGLVAQWLRAALEDPSSRGTALRYATGITLATAGWVLRLVLHDAAVLSAAALQLLYVALVIVELGIPIWAEGKGPTSWHPHHVAERYGLFAIILLGESVFVASTGVERVLASGGVSGPLVAVAVSALVLLFALWWLYFLPPTGDDLAAHRDRAYLWGYGSFGIFAALAAVGAGLEVAVEHTGHHIAASPVAVTYAVAIPVTVFLLLLWALHATIASRPVCWLVPMVGGSLVILLLPLAAYWLAPSIVVAAIAATSAAIVATTITYERLEFAVSRRRSAPSPRQAPSES